MKKFFKWLLLLIIALAISVAVVLYNPRIIKAPMERYLSNVAGYTVSLKGDLEIQTGRLIEISARKIHVSGPDWASQEDLIAVGNLNLRLNTASIFKDILLIEAVRVDNLQLNLETNAEGKGNWITANKPASAPENVDGGSLVVFNDIQVRNAVIQFRNGKTGIENILNIESLSHQQQADGMLHTTLNGDLNDRLVEYVQTAGPYQNLLDGRDISYNGAGHFGELSLKGDAFIDNLLAPKSPRFNLDMQGPDIDEITAMLGIDDLGGGSFSLRARGQQTSDHYEADINGKIGDISLSVSASSSDIEDLRELDLNAAINGPSLAAFTRVFGLDDWPDKPFSLKGQAERVGSTLSIRDLSLNIGGTKLLLDALLTEFPTLEASRIKLVVAGDEIELFHELLGIRGVATGAFNLNGSIDLSPSGVELLKVDLETSLGTATLSGTLGKAPAYIGSKLDLHLDGGNANSVVSAFGIDMLPEKPFNLNTRLELVENGLRVERGVLVTFDDERLELDGFIAFDKAGRGTDVDIKVSGRHFAKVLGRYAANIEVPDSPYEFAGHIQVEEGGIRLDKLSFGYEGISLQAGGLMKLEDRLSGTALDFQINGEDLSALKNFPAIGDSMDIFVPGQAYQAAGRFVVEKNRWRLSEIKGRIGKTSIDFDATISKQAGMAGSSIRFSVNGPGLNEFLVKKDEPGLPAGTFETSGQVMLSDDTLSISDLSFKTLKAHGQVALELGWPYTSSSNINFNADIQGEDIRNFLPLLDSFEAAKAPFRLNAAGGKKGNLITVKKFNSNIGNLQVSLTGQAQDNIDTEQAEIAFTIHSEDISTLGRLNGRPLPALPLQIKADFIGDTRSFVFRNLVGTLGDSRLNGELEVSLQGPKPDIRITATSDYIDIRPFLKAEKPDKGATATSKPDRLIPATPLPLDALAARDLEVSLTVAELQYLQDSITGLLLSFEQHDGALNVSQLSYEAPRGKVSASLSIIPDQADSANVKIDLNTDAMVFNLTGVSDDKLDQIPAFDIDFHATGEGVNLQEIAGSMDGSFYMASNGGNAESVDLSILETFIFDQIFSVLMPKSKETLSTQFDCIATNLEIIDGLVTTKPAFAFSTGKIGVVIKGSLDLKTEKMNFNFNSTPTKALKFNTGELFYPYILISGTLANPSVGVDPGKAALHGGAAVVTMGASVLAKGLLDRAGNASPVCEEILKNPPQSEKPSGGQ